MKQEELQFFYELIVSFAFLLSFAFPKKNSKITSIFSGLLISGLALLIGTRPENIGTDTFNYYLWFEKTKLTTLNDIKDNLSTFGSEPLFNIILIIGHIIGSYTSVLIIISFITLLFAYHFSKRLCNIINVNNSTALFCCYLTSFYIFGQQINIIRSGLAAVLLLNYYLSIFQSNKKSAIYYGFLAIGIHFSSIFGIILPIIAKIFKISKNTYLVSFFVFLILAYLNFGILNIPFFSSIDLGTKGRYLTSDNSEYITGFRASFALFNTFFAIVFYKYLKPNIILSKEYFRLFILFSILFFVCFQIPYSDRIGALSWNLIPFLTYLCALQIFKHKQNKALLYTFISLFVINIGINFLA